MRESIPESDARRLLGGGPVVLVTTRWRAVSNVMPAAFVTPLSFEPPLVGLSVHRSRHTHDMITYSEEFALNIPTRELLHHCQYTGSVSGRDADKLELTRLPTFRARKVEAPLLEGCVGHIECGVQDALTMGDHTLFVGRVVAAQAEKDAFDALWLLTDDDLKPLHHLGLNYYAVLAERLEARIPSAAEDTSIADQIGRASEDSEEEARERRERKAEDADRQAGGGRVEG